MKKTVYATLFVMYFIICILITICLLNYNDKGDTTLGSKTLIVVSNDRKVENYKTGELLIIDNKKNQYKTEEEIIYYDSSKVEFGKIKEVYDNKILLENDINVTNKNIIGKKQNIKSLGYIGIVLGVLESKYGYLLCIVLPMTLILFYEIFTLIKFLKNKEED